MDLRFKDYNSVSTLINKNYQNEWNQISRVLSDMPLHLKASDQAGLKGQAIFDPVGTNAYIKSKMTGCGWGSNVNIPNEFRFLGKDIDFVKRGLLVEVQFSNYPFLMNNIQRSDLFFKSETVLGRSKAELLIIVAKAHMFPASQSTLYYEQAINQLDALVQHGGFSIPVRLAGLESPMGRNIPSIWTTYDNPRYSRKVIQQEKVPVDIAPGNTARSRAVITR
ncbi:MAG: restriction endonuclease [Proteobacteria bacterium]|nr:MAG: restriction endonuclease [Pseudomonadota bacterium]